MEFQHLDKMDSCRSQEEPVLIFKFLRCSSDELLFNSYFSLGYGENT
jgi:hypothetical protein